MAQCKIYLENYTGNYYAGSEIRGRIECYFDEEISLRGIKIRIKCKEYNSWNGTESYTDPVDHKTKTRSIVLVGEAAVLNHEQMLFGSGSATRTLGRGRHVYPFSYCLPYDIPSSFKGPYGNITYKIKATVDRPMKFDYEDEFIFLVTSPIDFNQMSKNLQDISNYSDEKTVCCWCCQGGNLTVDVELPKIAFVAGETIPFKVHVTNLSNSNVEHLKVKFVKTVKYRVTSPQTESKEDVDNIVDFTEHGVGAHGEHTYNLQLAIPNYIEVPNFTKCSLFQVSYNLRVTAEMPTCTLDLDVDVWDIQMGHVTYFGPAANITNSSIPTPGGFIVPPIVEPGANVPSLPVPGYPPAGGAYPAAGGVYPPSGGIYPPAAPTGYPSPSPMYPASNICYPPSAPGYPGTSNNKPVNLPGPPSAPNAPFGDNSKSREAAGINPSAPMNNIAEPPPPSYNEVQQNAGFIHPHNK